VNYSTELEVANDDLSLRPGMTATVDIAIVDKKDIIVVPNSALRFDPEAAARSASRTTPSAPSCKASPRRRQALARRAATQAGLGQFRAARLDPERR
jgi:hypothetical protein